ncbi:MAG: precorrin-3B C(17)-methyltransferase [Desulfobacteraceae bacterium 4572_123]|nr:MAG: precorrin-3B C(17)-methyltransferase [Desulfobacteraceae bacterium 4572_123]
MRSSSNSCGTKRGTCGAETNKSERDRGHCQKNLYIVGIGPGDIDHMSRRAVRVLESVDAVAGYTTYIDLIRPILQDKQIVSTGMTREIERIDAALDIAMGGKSCAVVSSGDPGVYAMAGLVFEMCRERKIPIVGPGCIDADNPEGLLQVEVIPGIPALCSGASLLGAPLTHDFAAISLSDLLTPWELIESRLDAAAKSDFVIVLYNPKSKKRKGHLEKAQQIVLQYRDSDTPVGIVVSAMRRDQDVRIIPLRELHLADVNMQTTVFIGSSASVRYLDFMVTPRGYRKKYDVG